MSNENTVAEATTEKPVVVTPPVETTQVTETTPEVKPDDSLSKLNAEELISIIHETRTEAKNRRLTNKELTEKMGSIEAQTKLDETAALEKNNEWQKLHEQYKDETKDYEDLKAFKISYLEKCKADLEILTKGLTQAENELFELSANNRGYDEQIVIAKKLLANRKADSVIETTQSAARTGETGTPPSNTTVPFGNNGTVTQMAMKALENLRN